MIRNDKTILLTGASGYLGSCLLKMLVKNGFQVALLLRKSSSLHRIKKEYNHCAVYFFEDEGIVSLFKNHKIHTVINTITEYGRQGDTAQLIQSNIIVPLQLLKESVNNEVRYFINTDTSLSKFVNPYSLSKHHFRDWLYYYRDKIIIKNIQLEYFFGPGDSSWKFVTMVLTKMAANCNSIDFTTGSQLRNFIFITDVVDAYKSLLYGFSHDEQNSFEEYIVKGWDISIKDMIFLCRKVVGNRTTTLNFGALPDRDGQPTENSDRQSIKLLNDTSRLIPLEEALQITYHSISNQQLYKS